MSDKILFQCDYNEGAHPKVLERLMQTNMEQTPGYSEDKYCEEAREKIRKACGDDSLAVHFLVGGTQTNVTVINAALRKHQGVLCAVTGHINVHETGAVEACGHKVLGLESPDGKITAAQVAETYEAHIHNDSFEHMVQPKMVYISNPTEVGTIYSKAELTALSETCHKYGLYLFLDGARLGYGLAAPDNDLTLPEIAALCDVFYIGGTKVGALFGEAVVIKNPELAQDFRYLIKQNGGMLAKGRLLGVQFYAAFKDGLYDRIGAEEVRLALRLRDGFRARGWTFLVESPSNQQFPILPDALIERLKPEFSCSHTQSFPNGMSAVRFCTSWATTDADIDALLDAVPINA